MAKLSAAEIAALTGDAAPEPTPLVSKADHAMSELDAFDAKMRKHFEAGQQPGESYEKAYVRQLQESPGLYDSIQRKTDEIKTRHLGNGAISRPVGQQ